MSEGMQQTHADLCHISDSMRELPSATYFQRFHLSASVHGSNCLQKFSSGFTCLGWNRKLNDLPGSGFNVETIVC